MEELARAGKTTLLQDSHSVLSYEMHLFLDVNIVAQGFGPIPSMRIESLGHSAPHGTSDMACVPWPAHALIADYSESLSNNVGGTDRQLVVRPPPVVYL